jgi:hypothetical protein
LWAARGAGSGSFGVITRMTFNLHNVSMARSFDWEGIVSQEQAARALVRWQDWFCVAPRDVSGSLFAQKDKTQRIRINIRALQIGESAHLLRDLESIIAELHHGGRPVTRSQNFTQAIAWFSNDEDGSPCYTKSKSDILNAQLDYSAAAFVLDLLPIGVDAEFFTLGGAMSDLHRSDTAFAHRDANLSIQWGVSWERPAAAKTQVSILERYYEELRPLMSDAALVNYADCDLAEPTRSYWGPNVPRLIAIKRKFDPFNLFHHALSVPTRLQG